MVARQLAIGAGSAVIGAVVLNQLQGGGAGGGGGLGGPGVLTRFLPSEASDQARRAVTVAAGKATEDRTPVKSSNVKGSESGDGRGGETGGLEPLGKTRLEDFTGRESEVTVFRDPSGEIVVPGYDVDVGEGTVRAVSPSTVEKQLGLDAVSGTPSSVDDSPTGAGYGGSFDPSDLVSSGADLRSL